MLGVTVAGRWLALLALARGPLGTPTQERGGEARRVTGADGTELQVELYGPPDGVPLVLTHGWGTNSTEWYYAKRALANRYRLIVWDLRGLGRSRPGGRGGYRLEAMAQDLAAVVTLAGEQPAILVGHSIGGMLTLTFCRLFPEQVGQQVAGVILVNTTFTSPVATTTASGFFRAIQKPVLEPLLHLTVWLSPVVWLMNWLSFCNGLAHVGAALTGFAGRQTRGQLDFATRLSTQASPGVLARGVLATFRFDERATLSTIRVPSLVITGDRDRVLVPEASAEMARLLPAAERVTLRRAGHMGLLEQHEQFTATVAAFCAQSLAMDVRRRPLDEGKA